MIHEIDEAVRGLLKEEALDGADLEVVFEAPTTEWSARRNAPTINAYLYDIREDVRKRTRGLVNSYEDGIVVGRSLPPRYFNLSYLLTAWTQRPEDEHRLLAQMLGCLIQYEALPPARLGGALAELGLPVEIRVALPPPEDRSFADVWSALGGELKPSIDLVISTPLLPARQLPAGPPVSDGTVVSLRDTTGPAADLGRRKHRVPDAAAGSTGAATGASVGEVSPAEGPAAAKQPPAKKTGRKPPAKRAGKPGLKLSQEDTTQRDRAEGAE